MTAGHVCVLRHGMVQWTPGMVHVHGQTSPLSQGGTPLASSWRPQLTVTQTTQYHIRRPLWPPSYGLKPVHCRAHCSSSMLFVQTPTPWGELSSLAGIGVTSACTMLYHAIPPIAGVSACADAQCIHVNKPLAVVGRCRGYHGVSCHVQATRRVSASSSSHLQPLCAAINL